MTGESEVLENFTHLCIIYSYIKFQPRPAVLGFELHTVYICFEIDSSDYHHSMEWLFQRHTHIFVRAAANASF